MSAIELGKSLSKLMKPITLFEMFRFITSIKVFYVTTCTHSRKSVNVFNKQMYIDVQAKMSTGMRLAILEKNNKNISVSKI